MNIIDFEHIRNLNIPAEDCIRWAKEALYMKDECILPPKSVIRKTDEIFLTSMPCCLPTGYYGVKVVTRFPGRKPSIQSELMLYNSETGEFLALMDAVWITAMRTGAVAALSIKELENPGSIYSFIGLGNTARTTLLCLLSLCGTERIFVNLLAYKGQEESFMERFEGYDNIEFRVYTSVEKMIRETGVLISSITNADKPFAPDDVYPQGITVVPIHTKGFQNCDLFFDKIFADDTGHVKGFKYFDRFKSFDEFSNVLTGKNPGRENENEQILVYNVGIAMHDIYFASKIYQRVNSGNPGTNISDINVKFWV